jgi:prenyltransferase beta subunit
VLGLRAAGAAAAAAAPAAGYLRSQAPASATDLELQILALAALGEDVGALADRLEQLRLPSGRIGPAVNSTIWGVLALRGAGRAAGAATVSFLLRSQRHGGGWAWSAHAAVDSNDTAAAIEALRAAAVPARSAAIRRGIAYLRALRNRDGGFAWSAGADSDAQSTAWALQAFAAAGADPGKAPFRYLASLRRPDGSYRYSARYVATPVWITAQVLAALAGKPFPLR